MYNNGLRNFNDYPSNMGAQGGGYPQQQGQGYGGQSQYQYSPNMNQPYGGYRLRF